MKTAEKLINTSEAVFLGEDEKLIVCVSYGKATIRENAKNARVIEKEIESQYGEGGEDYFIFYSKIFNCEFAVPTSGGGDAEWIDVPAKEFVPIKENEFGVSLPKFIINGEEEYQPRKHPKFF